MTSSSPDRRDPGEVVRDAWVNWAREQPDINSHPDWVIPWALLAARYREVDDRIYSAVEADVLGRHQIAPLREEITRLRMRIRNARRIATAFLNDYGTSSIELFKVAIDLATALRNALGDDQEDAADHPADEASP